MGLLRSKASLLLLVIPFHSSVLGCKSGEAGIKFDYNSNNGLTLTGYCNLNFGRRALDRAQAEACDRLKLLTEEATMKNQRADKKEVEEYVLLAHGFLKLDENEDGQLSADEIQEFFQIEIDMDMFEDLDQNGDGLLSLEEAEEFFNLGGLMEMLGLTSSTK